ncbi:transcription antitermination protein NusB [Acholeplasma laidlawii]|jgi:N utilization substance protein B|uniref:Transcription antitermination factor n=2 Tax=Acholeplasma laidlawii TaxID=2148 RepID=A9NFG4_ACHLI|nr:transcription antitermination protein NusB [Acholeplasma laidlawii]ABX81094.1 transcription antitermination factor [Acholeplasma laidlawii PG-8A]NWH10338.1 transcription antitermination protein NusB [Acholeplasma laidlawii]NWH11727.1 transcription antitermination protein NusB [Acholeplasma laidlawii]NWH12865.1 transcription antitermination protein NusB [Acholeplasma laidlawii]NWH15189.1 transcription antitermination protein NusB [Acholeplasma laidlawii]
MQKTQTQYKKLMEVMYQYSLHKHVDFLDYTLLEDASKEVINGMIDELEHVDFLISSTIKNYTIDRLNLVDLAIIRVAVYALLKEIDPAEIVINEAIELSKEYTDLDDEKQHKFNNSLIDNIYKKIK